jgi:hypothetical protein|tara:strand:+ start:430 stop:984 length:555 start_codon:yes stop_codon:yes gene_type:complete
MFDEFLFNIYRSIRLDKSLYQESKTFANTSLYFTVIIMILCGIAGGVAKNSIITLHNLNFIQQSSIYSAGIANIFPWALWSVLIYLLGVKVFGEKNKNISFKNILIVVGYAHAPMLFRYFIFIPKLIMPIIFITEIWFLVSLTIGIKEVLNYKTKWKSIGVILISLLIITTLGILLMSPYINVN